MLQFEIIARIKDKVWKKRDDHRKWEEARSDEYRYIRKIKAFVLAAACSSTDIIVIDLRKEEKHDFNKYS